MVRGLLLVCTLCVVATSCIQSQLATCGDQVCSLATTCVNERECLYPEELAACDGKADGERCLNDTGLCFGGGCMTNLCGNGVLDDAPSSLARAERQGEACDDGNTVSGDGCSADCRKVEHCGDTVLDVGESCDDGNDNSVDGCMACRITTWSSELEIGSMPRPPVVANVSSVAYDSAGRLYIADTSLNRIVRQSTTGELEVFAGAGVGYAGDGGLAVDALISVPKGLSIDDAGRVYFVAFATTSTVVRRINTDGTIETVVGGGAQPPVESGFASLTDFQGLVDTAIDTTGHLVVSDIALGQVWKIDDDGFLHLLAGNGTSGSSGDDGPAIAAQLARPDSIAFDSNGDLYIGDGGNYAIRRVNSIGTIQTVAGILGVQGSAATDGVATEVKLSGQLPGLVSDGHGGLYFSDLGIVRIRHLDNNGNLTTVAGADAVSTGDGPALTVNVAPGDLVLAPNGDVVTADLSGQIRTLAFATGNLVTTNLGNDLTQPATSFDITSVSTKVLADHNNHVYVLERNRSRVFSWNNGVLTAVAGTGISAFGADGMPARETPLYDPQDIALDSAGQLYISEYGAIRRIEPDGTLSTYAGGGTAAVADNVLASSVFLPPGKLAIDDEQNVYFTIEGAHKVTSIWMIDAGGTVHFVGGLGTSVASGVPANQASFLGRVALVTDQNQRLIIADREHNCLRTIENGIVRTIAGLCGTTSDASSGDGGPATAARLDKPTSLAFDSQHRLYIADERNHRIRRIANDIITTVVGSGTTAGSNIQLSGDGGPAMAATLTLPSSVTIDSADRILFSEGTSSIARRNRIRRVTTDGMIDTIIGAVASPTAGPIAGARLSDPRQLALVDGSIYSAAGESGTIERVWFDNVETFAGYQHDRNTGNLAHYSALGLVTGIAYDRQTKQLYAADSAQLIAIHIGDPADPQSWTLTTIINNGIGFVDGAASIATFGQLGGLFFDDNTRVLYITDQGNHAIRTLTDDTGEVATLVNRHGRLGARGDGGPALEGELFRPSAVAKCPNGDVLIADTGNNRIRRVQADGILTTVIGTGERNNLGEAISLPTSVICDRSNNIYAASAAAVRLRATTKSATETIFETAKRSCLSGLALRDNDVLASDRCTGTLRRISAR